MRADADSSRVSARRHRRVERALAEARRSRHGPGMRSQLTALTRELTSIADDCDAVGSRKGYGWLTDSAAVLRSIADDWTGLVTISMIETNGLEEQRAALMKTGEDARARKDAAYERYYAGRKASLDERSERLYAEADLIWDYIDALLRMTAEIRDESYEVEGYGLETAACCQIALQSFYEDRKETGGSR